MPQVNLSNLTPRPIKTADLIRSANTNEVYLVTSVMGDVFNGVRLRDAAIMEQVGLRSMVLITTPVTLIPEKE